MNFSADRLRGNFGLRFVKTEIESTAFVLGSDVPTLDPALFDPTWLQTQENDDDYVLPSFNVVYDLTDDVVLRFAGAKVIAWAPYNQMAPNTFLNDTTLTGSGGNADLGRLRVDQLQPLGRVVLRRASRCWRRRCSTRTSTTSSRAIRRSSACSTRSATMCRLR